MSTVVDAVADESAASSRDPCAGGQIEVCETTLQRVTPGAWFGSITASVNQVAQRLTYGR